MNAMKLMSNQYVISDVTSASQQATLVAGDVHETNWIIDNSLGSTPVFVTSGVGSTIAVYPTSATVPKPGAIVGAGMKETYGKDPVHDHIAAIRESGTADVAIKVGSGE